MPDSNSASNQDDFQIESGVLIKYKGASLEPTIPTSVGIIGVRAFMGLPIQKIIIPHSVFEIGAYAFADCVKLKEVRIPDSVKTIGCRAFLRCFNLSNLVLETHSFSCPYGDNYPFIGTPMHESFQRDQQQKMDSELRTFRIHHNLCPNCGKFMIFGTCFSCGSKNPKQK